ncbi:MAG: heavy-metal-associated domain-containing protein [Actinomycetota bacterium]|nr:heavy-metal-associated domain-containing protein [Actinomycetota bacterium]
MTCRHCVRAISAQVQDVVGVESVEADVTSRTVRVRGSARPDALRSAIADAGYEAVELRRPSQSQDPEGGHLS